MKTTYRYMPGGLMRCCIQTLDEHWAEREVEPTEGETLPCQWCSSRMIYTDGAWRWDHDYTAPE